MSTQRTGACRITHQVHGFSPSAVRYTRSLGAPRPLADHASAGMPTARHEAFAYGHRV